MSSFKKGGIYILSSPSGAGKTTLVKKIAKNKNFLISVSHTTRPPRPKEKNDDDKLLFEAARILMEQSVPVKPKVEDIKPKKINNRRYYSTEQVETIKTIKFLLKDKGLTIFGVKNLIKFKINKLDEINDSSLKAEYYKDRIKIKSKEVLERLKKLKTNGKKNTY